MRGSQLLKTLTGTALLTCGGYYMINKMMNDYQWNLHSDVFDNHQQLTPSWMPLMQAEEKKFKAPQSGVITGNYAQMAIITIKLKDSFAHKEYAKVLKAVGEVPQIISRLSNGDAPNEDEDELPPVMASVGLSTRFWSQLSLKDPKAFRKPDGYTADFDTKKGEFGSMPFKESEIVLHVKAKSTSLCYETIQEFVNSLPKDSIENVQEHYGFMYQDSRDLTKFIDGIVNPSGVEDRQEAALNHSGGSFLLHQKWVHHHNPDSKYTLKQQEEFVGRERAYGAELSSLPPTSHVARMRRPNGEIIPILRQSFPFGTVTGDHGLLFISYSSNTEKYETLLNAMVGKVHGKHNDAIMKFSKCEYSNYYYVPSLEELEIIKSKY
ncbi:hypothetical protein FDP41_012386 [Naegleria fowleri]|uniref:Uncharacterized protein n=1 Tax=Naegleria fowleri TaxID=5763 RepID=A0A6A5C8X0_NAEFO|nr:uncharacterized protein FDP41_012386 [Naegleria fowleri]KAF0981729.1 hypothetical protein FDP41_012386 [Naegleria fowleri]CAG4712098.1 unnamed protein product [Naegleria fowleri]